MITDSPKNGRRIIPFQKFSKLWVKKQTRKSKLYYNCTEGHTINPYPVNTESD